MNETEVHEVSLTDVHCVFMNSKVANSEKQPLSFEPREIALPQVLPLRLGIPFPFCDHRDNSRLRLLVS